MKVYIDVRFTYMNDVFHAIARRPLAADAILASMEADHNIVTIVPNKVSFSWYENCIVVAEMLAKNVANTVISVYLFLRRSCSIFNK